MLFTNFDFSSFFSAKNKDGGWESGETNRDEFNYKRQRILVSPKAQGGDLVLARGPLTFDAKKGGALDADADLVARALARVIGVVVDAVQLAARPLLHVPHERGDDGLEVVGARVGRQNVHLDRVLRAGQPQRDRLPVLEPLDAAHRVALDAARQRDVLGVHQGTVVRWQAFNERRWSCKHQSFSTQNLLLVETEKYSFFFKSNAVNEV